MKLHSLTLAALALSCGTAAIALEAPKPATAQTAAANKAVAAAFDLGSAADMQNASRGLIARTGESIKNDKGELVWDVAQFNFIKGAAPDTVNPSLWRMEGLNNETGLYQVTEGVYQLRGFDMANMTLVRGNTGWIIIDPLMSAETSRAALEFAQQKLGRRPVVAVIFTHSHVDHFGGVRGVVDEADVKAGRVPVIAPDGFMETAVAENVLAGNAMTRRAYYQFGTALPANAQGTLGNGLGKTLSQGTMGLIAPTDIIKKTAEQRTVDGVQIVFEMANGSEAPAEMAFYFPKYKALCLSEVVTANMHNIYTLRGAKTRDALSWSKYINEMMDFYPEAAVAFRSHHWPVWGSENIHQHLANQRDLYRFIHDEAVNQLNKGKKPDDLGNMTYTPKGLANDFSTHGYYGTLSHNLRAVYNYYIGFYDGNPATLHQVTPLEQAQGYVQAIGGIDAVMDKARAAFEAGNYRWAAQLNNNAVMAEPGNERAKALQADILEQLGYQAESSVWRNEYLLGARELREGAKPLRLSTQGPDMVRGMTLDMIFDFLAVRLNHRKVDGLNLGLQINFTDSHETYALELSNSVLNNTKGRQLKHPNVTLSLTRPALFKMLLAKVALPELVKAGEAKIEGDPQALGAVFANLDNFDPLFPIITP